MTVPAWAWAAFAAFVITMLVLDLLVLHRKAHEVPIKEAAAWTAVWVALGLGFAGLLWAWRGGGAAESYLAGYLIEKSLSLDNVFVFAVIFSAFAIPPRYQHRVLMLGIAGALVMRAAFIAAGAALLEHFHPVSYLFGALLLAGAVKMARGGADRQPRRSRSVRAVSAILPATGELRGQRFVVRERGRLLATPLLMALIVVEATDVIFAIDSIPAILAITTDTFVVYTSNVFAVLGMRALYFLLAGAAARFRYLQPGLAVILPGIAVKMLTADLYEAPTWASPAFIVAVLAVVAVLSVRDSRRPRTPAGPPGELRSHSASVRLLSRTEPWRLPAERPPRRPRSLGLPGVLARMSLDRVAHEVHVLPGAAPGVLRPARCPTSCPPSATGWPSRTAGACSPVNSPLAASPVPTSAACSARAASSPVARPSRSSKSASRRRRRGVRWSDRAGRGPGPHRRPQAHPLTSAGNSPPAAGH